MTGPAINWESIRLVVFDVDGTLYNQKTLRLRILNTIASRSLETLMILRLYRKLRETIGKQEIDGFERVLLAPHRAEGWRRTGEGAIACARMDGAAPALRIFEPVVTHTWLNSLLH
jgi:phosphoglycolate phosphatase-like HAD superfamily hydrolase